jgi:membrane protein YdbS with pleckstrin-like domain
VVAREDSIKDDDEEILWTDKPKFIPYAITALSLGFGVVIFAIIYYVAITSIRGYKGSNNNFIYWVIGLPALLFCWSFITKIFSYSNTSYAFSNKRIMVRTGFFATGFKIIDYDKISDMQVTVNLVERAFNVGTIKFYSGRTESNDDITTKIYDRWEAIAHPYDVFKQLKKVTVDIKTDFNFPNALRPELNPGYRTKYKPQK